MHSPSHLSIFNFLTFSESSRVLPFTAFVFLSQMVCDFGLKWLIHGKLQSWQSQESGTQARAEEESSSTPTLISTIWNNFTHTSSNICMYRSTARKPSASNSLRKFEEGEPWHLDMKDESIFKQNGAIKLRQESGGKNCHLTRNLLEKFPLCRNRN